MNDAMCLVDIARHFSVLDDLEPVKVTFEHGRVVAEAIDGLYDKASLAAARLSNCYEKTATVMCYGQFDFAAPTCLHTVGIPNPLVLRQFADLQTGVVPQVTHSQSGGGYGVQFCGLDGLTAFAVLASGKLTNQQVNVPSMPRSTPDVCFYPSASVINLMKSVANDAKRQGAHRFWPCMSKRGLLSFSFDLERNNDPPARFDIASGLPYCQLRPYSYDAAAVLKVLELSNTDRPVRMSFLNAGGLILDVESALGGHYKFVFLPKCELISDSELAVDFANQLARGCSEDACMSSDWEPDQ